MTLVNCLRLSTDVSVAFFFETPCISDCSVNGVQKEVGTKLCSLPADKWSFLASEVSTHVDLQHIIDEVAFIHVSTTFKQLIQPQSFLFCRNF